MAEAFDWNWLKRAVDMPEITLDVYLDMPRVLDNGIRLRLAATVLTDWIELHVPEIPTAI